MPTRTPDTGPFALRGTISRDQLIAYAEGRLTPAEQRDVEAHLEHDPLLRDALEGLQQSGADEALKDLDHLRPTPPTSRVGPGRIFAGVVAGAFVVVTVWYLWPAKEHSLKNNAIGQDGSSTSISSDTTDSVDQPLEAAEIAAAHELPESLHIGHAPNDRHARSMASEQAMGRDEGIGRIEPIRVEVKNPVNGSDTDAIAPRSSMSHASRSSLQLLFLHDLKLVHPQELYARDPLMRLTEQSVAARYADRTAQDSVRNEVITVSYTAFMNEALDRFVHNDHKACLDDLRFLLEQYPNDVNALFYAGLCCYNLGLYAHARTFLHRAATHPVDVFDEEAQWYHALTLERLGEQQAAKEALSRIAAQGGFYAGRAKARLE